RLEGVPVRRRPAGRLELRLTGRLIGRLPRPGRADPNRSDGLLKPGGVARGEGGLEILKSSAVAGSLPCGTPQGIPVEVETRRRCGVGEASCRHRGVGAMLTGVSCPERPDEQCDNNHQIHRDEEWLWHCCCPSANTAAPP